MRRHKIEINPEKGVWQYQDAKAKLSQVMDTVADQGMQMIVRNRDEVFIVLTQEKYNEMQQPKNSLVEFFQKAPYPELNLEIKREKEIPRKIDL